MPHLIAKDWRVRDISSLPIQERLLKIRGIGHAERDNFFNPQLSQLSDPFGFNDMETALERIGQAIEQQERIIIFGDYDVDGVTGTAILVRALLKLKAQVSYRLPHRVDDGYGLKNHLIDEMAVAGAKLIITVDNGISAAPEVAYAKSKDIDVIITDHHSIPSELPEAVAILHPKVAGEQYPFKDLCGSAVAFMLAACLLYSHCAREEADEFLLQMLDLVALGTIADCVPLIRDNRILVKFGLEQLARTVHPGLQHLMRIAEVGKNGFSSVIDTHTVEYVIAPRLNAGGRMDTALDALHLFLFPDDKSRQVAEKLHELNTRRQMETEKIVTEAVAKLEQEPPEKIIIVAGPWHIGIIGIVAARLAEKYGLPAIVLGEKEHEYVASCRSEGKTDIIGALRNFGDYFIHYGGHEAAAGFSIAREKYAEFKKQLTAFMSDQSDGACGPILYLDTVLTPAEINWTTYDFIQKMAPYGEANERPLFLFSNLAVKDKRTVGKSNTHLKMLFNHQGNLLEGIGFSLAEQWQDLQIGEMVDVAAELEKNEFNGNTKLNLIVRDMRSATAVSD